MSVKIARLRQHKWALCGRQRARPKPLKSPSRIKGQHLYPSIPRPRIAQACVCCDNAHLRSSPAILMPFVSHRAMGWAPAEINETWGLRTIKSGTALSVCQTLACPTCGLIFLDIRFDDYEMDRLYAGYRDAEYVALRETYEPGYSKINAQLAEGGTYKHIVEAFLSPLLSQPISILDWGGDTGKNTPFTSSSNKIHIYDVSQREVISGASFVSKQQLIDRSYDLVVCSQVLEHTPYPKDIVAESSKYLKSSGIFYIEVPHEKLFESTEPDIHLQKRHWHEHVNFFSRESLFRLVETVGMKIIKFETCSIYPNSEWPKVHQIACKFER